MRILVSDPFSSVGIEIFKNRIPVDRQGPNIVNQKK